VRILSAYQLGESSAAGPREKIGDDQATLDELAKIAASLAKTAEEQNRHIAAHDPQIASLLTAVESHDRQITSLAGSIESHDRQIASIIRALDKQRGAVNALAASVIAHDDQIEALGDRIDQFLNRLRLKLVDRGRDALTSAGVAGGGFRPVPFKANCGTTTKHDEHDAASFDQDSDFGGHYRGWRAEGHRSSERIGR
jgi:hypothetical protein